MPVRTGPTWWSWYSNDVTTPKLPPPPRRPQNRSAFSSLLACTSRPSAVTTSADTRLSHANPCFRASQPRPPPSVSPAMPVARHGAAGCRQAKRLRLVIELSVGRSWVGAHQAPRPDRRGPIAFSRDPPSARRHKSTGRPRCGRRRGRKSAGCAAAQRRWRQSRPMRPHSERWRTAGDRRWRCRRGGPCRSRRRLERSLAREIENAE